MEVYSKADHSWSNKKSIVVFLFTVYNITLIGFLLYTQLELVSVKKSQQAQNADQQNLMLDHITMRKELVNLTQCNCDTVKTHRVGEDGSIDLEKISELFNEMFLSSPGSDLLSIKRSKREVISKDNLDFSSLLRGRDGRDGPPGPPGPQGVQGPPGPSGKDGRDATTLTFVNHLINATVTQMVSTQMNKLRLHAKEIPAVAGATYVRWGRTVCSSDSSLIYKGRAGGQYYDQTGGSSSYLCMPEDPEYNSTYGSTAHNSMSGVEYEDSGNFKTVSGSNENVPCAVCQTKGRTTNVVFPAKVRCPDSSWTKEYTGILMAEYYGYKGRTEYICVDGEPEAVRGMTLNENGSMLYSVTVICSGAGNFGLCPPYKSGPLTCTVCSK